MTVTIGSRPVSAQQGVPAITPRIEVGDPKLGDWTGVRSSSDGAVLQIPGDAVFRYPDGKRGWYIEGFRDENDSARDWRSYYGLQLEIFVPKGRTFKLAATISTPPAALRQEYIAKTDAALVVNGAGEWQRIDLPWPLFDFDKSQSGFLKFARELRLSGTFVGGGDKGEIRLRDVHLIRAPVLAVEAAVRGKSVSPGQAAHYDVALANCTDAPQDVTLSFDRRIWSVMTPAVEPSHLRLLPGAGAACTVTVQLPANGIPPGGHETQKLLATVAGNAQPVALEFITARDVARPSILRTPEQWAAIRAKAQKYDWARAQAADYIKAADAWRVPEATLPPKNYSTAEKHTYVFTVPDLIAMSKTAIAYQLTQKKEYAEKVGLLLRRLSDDKTGYPSTFAAMNQGGPQEGENFQNVAIAYDAILDSGVLSAADRVSIERTFRLFMETFDLNLRIGNVGNWSTAQSTACLFCALSLGDLNEANRFLYGPGGFTDFVTKGIMDDGWWWECSTGYNMWVASELTQAGLACQPWGIDLLNVEFPANFSPRTITNPWALDPPYGVSFEKWGPNHSSTRSIKKLWDATPGISDYRGIGFGMNDGHEEKLGGLRLELAYSVYRDPAFAALIKQTNQRELIYGVPELPADTPKPYLNSGYAENIGYALLRSQTPGREPKDQIQAVLKIGTQGGFHGHFDRVSLDNLTRYGRSFWNPETIWYGYPNYMYKFFVQTSINHNMVVVDQKQQEAAPSTQLLFHTGQMMQVAAQETNARWSDPPYGGMKYFPGDTFASQMKKNVQSIPLAADREYGALGPYTDRVLQRRLAVVTDDYVVLADYVKSVQPHTFDNLFQMKNMTEFTASGKSLERHDAQFNPDPRRAAQFITDCDWYGASAPAVAKFNFEFGPGSDNAGTNQYLNEPGILKVDVRTLWPPKQEIMVGMPPEQHDSQQWVTYDVSGGGKSLAHGESGVWILGSADVDVPVGDLNEVMLSVQSAGGRKNALFWANPRLVTADGKETPVTDSTPANVLATPEPGKDYYGGPIKIAGATPVNALPTQPDNAKSTAVIHISLRGKNAARFKATLGGDYPFGDEAQRRKVYGIRIQGTEGRWLTVLEPYETTSMVKSAVALSAGKLRVELIDGRVQEITIHGLDGSGADVGAEIVESKDGRIVRQEDTSSIP